MWGGTLCSAGCGTPDQFTVQTGVWQGCALPSGSLTDMQTHSSPVTQSCPILRPYWLQHARPLCPSPTREFTQTHVHRIADVIKPSHPLPSPSPPAPSPSQYQGPFKWVSSSHQVAKVLEFQLQHQSFHWTPRTDPLGWTGWISLQSKGLSRVFSNTTVQKLQFFSTQLSL